MTATPSRLRVFVDAVEAAVDGPPGRLVQRCADSMRNLVANDDWLPSSMAVVHPKFYQQHLLHLDAQDRFSVISFVWGPGQCTPIHDHTVWGVIGILRGAEFSQRYEVGGGAPSPAGTEQLLEPGQVETLHPDLGDTHKVRNAFADRVSISIHLYGGNIGRVRRTAFDETNGRPRSFVSGYSSNAHAAWSNDQALLRE